MKPHAAGHFVTMPAPYDTRPAFVPAPLPPVFEFTPSLTNALARAEYALGGLVSIADFVPNPEFFIEPFLRMEAVLSSRIEGTQSSTEDVFRAEALETAPQDADTQEVINYLQAMQDGFNRISMMPEAMNFILIKELHAKLLDSVRGHDRSPGRVREITVWVGGRSLDYATYVPPPWQEVPGLLQDWERYLQECITQGGGEVSQLLQCAALHAQFELIHPFRDGNGRLGRLLMSLFLVAAGHISRPVLFLSAYFEQHRQEYYRRLQAISEEGDWTGWFAFFLRGVEEQSQQVSQVAKQILQLRSDWQVRLQQEDAPAYLFTLLDRLFENPYTTVPRIRKQLGVTTPTAIKSINKLIEMGLLEEITGRKRDRQYRATGLLRVLEG